MTTRLQHDLTYDATPAAVAAMLRDPSFRERVCERQRVISHEVAIESVGDAATIRVERVQAVSGLPAVATKIVGNEIDLVHEEKWRDLTDGDYGVRIPGKPGHISGTVTLREDGEQTHETVTLEISVSIPFVGGKLEKIALDLIKAALRTEHEIGVAYLAG